MMTFRVGLSRVVARAALHPDGDLLPRSGGVPPPNLQSERFMHQPYSNQNGQSQSRTARRSAEEVLAWKHLYRDVRECAAAAEVVQMLDQDPEARRNHLALYLTARKTLRRQHAIDQRNARVGAAVRSAMWVLLVAPLSALRRFAGGSTALAAEVVAPGPRSKARERVVTLKAGPDSRRIAHRDAPAASSQDSSRSIQAA
jgi:hypothetical protein